MSVSHQQKSKNPRSSNLEDFVAIPKSIQISISTLIGKAPNIIQDLKRYFQKFGDVINFRHDFINRTIFAEINFTSEEVLAEVLTSSHFFQGSIVS